MLLPYYNPKGPYEKCIYTQKYTHTQFYIWHVIKESGGKKSRGTYHS